MTQNEFDQLVIELNEYSFNIMKIRSAQFYVVGTQTKTS